MSAAEETIRMARAIGVRLAVEGDALVLDVEQPPPPEFLEVVRSNKPEIISLLAPGRADSVTALAFVRSGFERRANDDYQTIDPRCAKALLESWDVPGVIWEPCAREGSALADELERLCDSAVYRSADAFQAPSDICRAAVTNPPYSLPLCDQVVQHLRDCVADGHPHVAAILLRSAWDHAKRRSALLDSPPYAGAVRLRFRPWWSAARTKQPIHDFQWLIFDRRHEGEPVLRYWPSSTAQLEMA